MTITSYDFPIHQRKRVFKKKKIKKRKRTYVKKGKNKNSPRKPLGVVYNRIKDKGGKVIIKKGKARGKKK